MVWYADILEGMCMAYGTTTTTAETNNITLVLLYLIILGKVIRGAVLLEVDEKKAQG